jgi:SAM-dependent methyltransferase
MDISSGMVTEYNNEASKAGFTPSQMHAVQGDIVSTSANFETHYDLIIMSLALHHIEDPEGIIAKLAQHLKPGTGVLVIADWIHPDESGCGDWRKQAAESDNPARHTVSRAGFRQDEMKMAFTQAGFEGFKWKPFEETSAIPGSANQRAFLARGVRAA